MNVKAILFDFDGVIIDSEPAHAKAKKLVLEKFNISYPPNIFEDFKGRPDKVFFEYVASKLDPKKQSSELYLDAKNSIFVGLVKEIKLIDGFLLFHQKVKSIGIKTAMVSSTSLHSLNLVDKIYQLSDLFDLIITGSDTDMHKPHPAPYLEAFKKLSAKTENTIVIEDSPNGIISAKKAGCFVFGLTSSFSSQELKVAGADETINDYQELARILKL
jgi:beta-phosphoglucomutase